MFKLLGKQNIIFHEDLQQMLKKPQDVHIKAFSGDLRGAWGFLRASRGFSATEALHQYIKGKALWEHLVLFFVLSWCSLSQYL